MGLLVRLAQYDHQRQALGADLRKLRVRARLTGVQLAEKTGISQSKISKIETARVLPRPNDVEAIIVATRPDPSIAKELLGRVRELSTEFASWRLAHKDGLAKNQIDIARLEARSTIIRTCQFAIIPGLLQNHDYARKVISIANISNKADVDSAIAERIRRQRLTSDRSRSFSFLIAEAALRARIITSSQQVAQIARIRSAASRPHLNIGILPMNAPLVALPLHSFVVFDQEMVAIETMTADVIVTDPRDVESYVHSFDTLSASALYGRDAITFLTALLDELGGRPDDTD